MEEIGTNWREMEEMTRRRLRGLCRGKNEEEWRRNMTTKESLKYYEKWKKKMGRGRMWKSTRKERTIKLYQSGSILTKSRTGVTELDRRCEVCDEKEDLKHVVMTCKKHKELREQYNIKKEEDMINILFNETKENYIIELDRRRSNPGKR